MDSSLPKTLQLLLDLIIRSIKKSGYLPWRNQYKPTLRRRLLKFFPCIQTDHIQTDDCTSVLQFISDLQVVQDHASILGVRLFLEKTRSFLPQDCYANLLPTPTEENWGNMFGRVEIEMDWVLPFLQDLHEVFEVPKLNNPRNVLVTSFVDFLLQLLIGKPHLFAFEGDLVITEFLSFVTIFQDTPFQTTENDGQVHTLLSQFETVANEAGRLVHSFIFSQQPPPSKKIDELLLEPINLLKADVIQFFNSTSYINNTPNTLHFSLSSVFIVDSFLYDLENLMNREDDCILEVKDEVEKLHLSLKHSWSLLNEHSDKTDE